MKYKDINRRLLAAEKLLSGRTTTRTKFESIRKLIKGIDPKLDKKFSWASKALKKVEKVKKGEVINLALEALPEKTPEQKRRKKAIFLFLRYWKQLKSEVKRVKKELKSEKGNKKSAKSQAVKQVSKLTRVIRLAKGPLGLITIAAALVVVLQSVSVRVIIKNDGCETIKPLVSVAIKLPGLSLPRESIPDGGQATATVPPLKFKVVSSANSIDLRAVGQNFHFDFEGEGIDVLFNGSSILGKTTQVNFGSKSEHEIILRCRQVS